MKRLNEYRMKMILVGFVIVGSLIVFSSNLWARPTTAREAGDLVSGWLKANPKPLGTSLGQRVKHVETFANENGETIYYIVYLQPSGFVIVSADDLIEPIIGFGQGDTFDPSPENSLRSLVTEDLNRRIASVRSTSKLLTVNNQPLNSESPKKWRNLIHIANTSSGKRLMALGDVSVISVSEVRVAPLVKSKWGQYTISNLWGGGIQVGEYCPLPCYNYYTPNNYLCGCPATALAQLMRYHEYPTAGIGVCEFTITIGWSNGTLKQEVTRGGDGLGGPYNWDLMPYVPDCNTSEEQRQAIGALCYDAGVSMNQRYSRTASGWPGCTNVSMKNALKTTFMYANAVHGYANESPIGEGLVGMINPNLDAKKPVILGTVQHAFICDGYGYDNSTLYHHLNMGWLGLDDFWYDLTASFRSPVDGYEPGWSLVCSCVYNIQTLPSGDGEIISGRVLDHNDEPLANVILYATSMGEFIAETETNDKGIYAFDCLESNTTYTINAALRGYGFSNQTVTTGISQNNSVISGNLWGVDLVGLFCDFNSDQKVDSKDMILLVERWGQDYPDFDVAPSPSGDSIIDVQDLIVLAEHLFEEIFPPELIAYWKLDEKAGNIAYDSVGGYDGILHGEPLWQPIGGQASGALEFDGIDDYVETDFVLNPAEGAFSAFAWIQGGAPGQAIISQTDGDSTGETWLGTDAIGGNLMTELVPQKIGWVTPRPLVSESVITDIQWHHVGLVWDGSYRALYVDGIEVAKDKNAQNPLKSADGGLYIGVDKNLTAGTFFSGMIDDVRIYNRVVSP